MLKEVDKAHLQEELQNLVETGAHIRQIGELLEERAAIIRDDVQTIAAAIPAEGLDTVHLPVSLMNQMVAALQELLRLIDEESYTHGNRQSFARKVWNGLLEAGLAPFLPPEPPRDPEEAALEKLRAEERMKRLMSNKWIPPRY